ncbi:hypothetical protein SLEP1_g51856 [Rubroshorea leprosula]|uniref:Protein kinase domain-containing protein n=1 Tax=Rubroshorea leprosula TaxID=152421 RepID=A0AAV5M765_9ROSI|nr:hypothetical protein SLEP1_g51856 [Rubroshorea leprosula]
MNFSGTLSPRVGILKTLTTLTLKGSGITGEIPEEFGNLSSLTSLDLENNHLSGEIPPSLGNLQKLQFFTLSQNNLTGAIPQSLSGLPNLINLFTGNSLNCVENSLHPCVSVNDSGGSRKPRIGIIVGTIGLEILVLLGSLLFFLWRGRRKGYKREVFVNVAAHHVDGDMHCKVKVDRRITFGQLKRFAWRELQLATDNFSEKNILGQGGFGKVYKGVLADSTKVDDLLILKVLVEMQLSNVKKRIALGAARGLEYLHEHCNPKIIHPDVKAANVLLDEDFESVVGDFGLAKLVDVRRTNVTTQVRGTMGHIAPEYLSTGKSSERTNVFGYGIMLLEVVTGQRAIDFSRLEEEDDVLLLDHVR